MNRANTKLVSCGLRGTSLADRALPSKTALGSALAEFAYGCEELNQDGSEDLRINVVWLTCNNAPLRIGQSVCNGIRGVAQPRGRPTVHDQGWGRGFSYSLFW